MFYRLHDYVLVDKTSFLNVLESPKMEAFIIFRRPPRFGKSLWLKTIELYYDISFPEEYFQFCFKNLQIQGKPPSQKYLIWYVDFNLALKGMK
jgi:hypothetical protein